MGIIYQATNIYNNKIYIGKTSKTLEYRKKRHLYTSKSKKNIYFYNAINKYGFDKFIWEILDTADTLVELNEKEIYWINKKNSMNENFGYNTHLGGNGGAQTNQKVLNKISESKKGKKLSDETKKKIGDGNRGKKAFFSEEAKLNMSKGQTGRKLSEETKSKILASRKKFFENMSEDDKIRISNSHKGKKHSDETKKKIGEALRKK